MKLLPFKTLYLLQGERDGTLYIGSGVVSRIRLAHRADANRRCPSRAVIAGRHVKERPSVRPAGTCSARRQYAGHICPYRCAADGSVVLIDYQRPPIDCLPSSERGLRIAINIGRDKVGYVKHYRCRRRWRRRSQVSIKHSVKVSDLCPCACPILSALPSASAHRLRLCCF